MSSVAYFMDAYYIPPRDVIWYLKWNDVGKQKTPYERGDMNGDLIALWWISLSFFRCTYELMIAVYFPLHNENWWLVIDYYSDVYVYDQGYRNVNKWIKESCMY